MSFLTVLVYLGAVIAVVSMWRGLWGLMDLYLWPDNPKRSNWFSFLIGLIVTVVVLSAISQKWIDQLFI